MSSYLAELTLRLAAGATQLPKSTRRRHASYLTGAQNPDGGFAGRQGTSDLYYTSFALRGLALLGALETRVARRAHRFLCAQIDRPLPSIEFISLATSAALLQAASGLDVFANAGANAARIVPTLLDRYRRDDGGYAKTTGSAASSTYHTFLAVACLQLAGAPLRNAEGIVELIRSRRREDGGFVEIPQMRDSGTNPTCAATMLLHLLEALDPPTRRGAVQFLTEMQTPEGGLRANTRVPVADLLSTFTGLVTLAELESASAGDLRAAGAYAERLELAGGGFRGGAWDDMADVEYTFYGLGVLSLLTPAAGALG